MGHKICRDNERSSCGKSVGKIKVISVLHCVQLYYVCFKFKGKWKLLSFSTLKTSRVGSNSSITKLCYVLRDSSHKK